MKTIILLIFLAAFAPAYSQKIGTYIHTDSTYRVIADSQHIDRVIYHENQPPSYISYWKDGYVEFVETKEGVSGYVYFNNYENLEYIGFSFVSYEPSFNFIPLFQVHGQQKIQELLTDYGFINVRNNSETAIGFGIFNAKEFERYKKKFTNGFITISYTANGIDKEMNIGISFDE